MVLAEVGGDLLDGIGRGDIQRQRRPADPRCGLIEGLRGIFDIDGDHVCAVAGEHLGDGGPDPAGRAGDDPHLAGQWSVPVGGSRGAGGTDPEHLSVYVGGLGGQNEPHRRLAPRCARRGGGGDVDQCGGGPVAQLLGERAGEALERSLGDVLADVADLIRGAAQHDDPGRRPEVAQQWREELEQPPQAGRVGDSGRVEDQTAEGVGPPSTQVVAYDVVVIGQRDAQRFGHSAVAADQQ